TEAVRIGRPDRRDGAARGESLEILLRVRDRINHRMTDLRAVEPLHRVGVPPRPELGHRMRGDRDAALSVDLVDGAPRALTEIEVLRDADGDQMVVRLRQNLLADEDGRSADRAREPAAD